MEEATGRLSKLLEAAMNRLGFLMEYPVRLAGNSEAVRGSTSVYVQTLRLVGDHPAWRQERAEFSRALTKGDLYLCLDEARWVELFPYMTVQQCPVCHWKETYFIDKWDGGPKRASIKSFERGHPVESEEIAARLVDLYRHH